MWVPRCFAFAKQNGGGGIIRQESSEDMAVNYEILCASA